MRVGSNLIEREQENERTSKGLCCLSGEKVPYRTDVPGLYVCSFASVIYVL